MQIVSINSNVPRKVIGNNVWFDLPEERIRMPIRETTPYKLERNEGLITFEEIMNRNIEAYKMYYPNGEPFLSRRELILDRSQNIKIGDEIEVFVVKVKTFNLIVETSNGIRGTIPEYEVSRSRIEDLTKFFKEGDSFYAKVITKNERKIIFSRKQATETNFFGIDWVVHGTITNLLKDESGAFVELSPRRIGIVDAVLGEFEPDESDLGKKIFTRIKSIKKEVEKEDRNYRLEFIDYLEY